MCPPILAIPLCSILLLLTVARCDSGHMLSTVQASTPARSTCARPACSGSLPRASATCADTRASLPVLANARTGGWSLDFALGGLSLLAQQVIFGPLAVTAIVLAILDKLLWLGAAFVALPSANLLLGMIPLIEFTIGVMIYGAGP